MSSWLIRLLEVGLWVAEKLPSRRKKQRVYRAQELSDDQLRELVKKEKKQ